MGKEAGEKGKRDGGEILVDGLKPPKPEFLAIRLSRGYLYVRHATPLNATTSRISVD